MNKTLDEKYVDGIFAFSEKRIFNDNLCRYCMHYAFPVYFFETRISLFKIIPTTKAHIFYSLLQFQFIYISPYFSTPYHSFPFWMLRCALILQNYFYWTNKIHLEVANTFSLLI